ncbi:uncharacterized protein [Hoplias malabaricus]|uniref:uncharacterized protein n=1 Tax=Hoplias malabaricus TaxID=27720 RepID=UPI003461C578
MMSAVVSATLPRTNNTALPTPVNFTLKHIAEIDPNGTLSCVYWNNTEWVADGCELLQSNNSHNVCSCVHLSTFALIIETHPPLDDDSNTVMDVVGTIAVVVGLVFLSLALLTFAFSVLLFIQVWNLTKIRSKQEEIKRKRLVVIGYVVPLVGVGVPLLLLTTITKGMAADLTDPCNNYTSLDQPWRGTNATGLYICDQYFTWNGWYRLLYYGMSVHMPESCVNSWKCGSYYPLWLNGPHPQITDGIVTRGVCGSWSNCCYWSLSIQVKACPGNYYVYKFVSPVGFCGAYCADVNTIAPNAANSTVSSTNTTDNSDPCNVYTVLSDDWRKLDSLYYTGYSGHDDTLVEWSGWYRLYLKGSSAQIAESAWCSSYMTCGGYTPLLLGGTHPLPQDGIVTREIFGSYSYVTDGSQCGSLKSNPIQVKACSGNYSVYRLVKPALSIPIPTYCAVVFSLPSYNPCNNYTTLNQSWRGINETGGNNCDNSLTWNGWYRLLYYGMSVRMPESCVNRSRYSTDIALWLNGSHPQITDGIVTRGVCGNSGSSCCYFRFTPIRVKACPGNYYVYEFVRPNFCNAAYCAVFWQKPIELHDAGL